MQWNIGGWQILVNLPKVYSTNSTCYHDYYIVGRWLASLLWSNQHLEKSKYMYVFTHFYDASTIPRVVLIWHFTDIPITDILDQ